MFRAAWFARWVNQLIPALPARREIVEIDRHVGDIVREVVHIELSDYCESMNRAGCPSNTCSWRY